MKKSTAPSSSSTPSRRAPPAASTPLHSAPRATMLQTLLTRKQVIGWTVIGLITASLFAFIFNQERQRRALTQTLNHRLETLEKQSETQKAWVEKHLFDKSVEDLETRIQTVEHRLADFVYAHSEPPAAIKNTTAVGETPHTLNSGLLLALFGLKAHIDLGMPFLDDLERLRPFLDPSFTRNILTPTLHEDAQKGCLARADLLAKLPSLSVSETSSRVPGNAHNNAEASTQHTGATSLWARLSSWVRVERVRFPSHSTPSDSEADQAWENFRQAALNQTAQALEAAYARLSDDQKRRTAAWMDEARRTDRVTTAYAAVVSALLSATETTPPATDPILLPLNSAATMLTPNLPIPLSPSSPSFLSGQQP